MKDLSIIRANSGFLLCVIATLFLFGCQSTATEEVEIDCRAEGTETCAEENPVLRKTREDRLPFFHI